MLRAGGYRYDCGHRSHSWFGSGGWFGARDVVKATVLAGVSSNDQAYLASPLSVLRDNPRDNPYGNSDESRVRDRFHETLVSAAWTRALSERLTMATTAYGFDAGGWFDVPTESGDPNDAWNYNLPSRWGGLLSAFHWSGAATTASLGYHVTRYHRDHWLYARPDLITRLYSNRGYKDEQSLFAKGSFTSGIVTWFGDAQVRFARFRYRPTEGSDVDPASVRWS